MKKLLSLSKVCLMALIMVAVPACTRDDDGSDGGNNGGTSGDYVDLGLPSGTKWKNANEKDPADEEYGFFTYNEAVATFGDKLPSKEQCEELVNECTWTCRSMGYKVEGPNGKSISLPFLGWRYDVGGDGRGDVGVCWSSTPDGSDSAWFLLFNIGEVIRLDNNIRSDRYSVRLVQD